MVSRQRTENCTLRQLIIEQLLQIMSNDHVREMVDTTFDAQVYVTKG